MAHLTHAFDCDGHVRETNKESIAADNAKRFYRIRSSSAVASA